MLMCDKHHRLIDKEKVAEHSANILRKMKQDHELRIEMLTSITEDMQSHVLLYGANVGQHHVQINLEKASPAMIPRKYPAEKPAIELSLGNSALHDNADLYWMFEREQLRRQFSDQVKRRIDLGDIKHLSVFGLAPQPLLIELGTLISDICDADVYQLHREPATWEWLDYSEDFEYIVQEPHSFQRKVALNISLSGTIENKRITNILGEDTSIWTLTIQTPNNDYLKGVKQLKKLRHTYRLLMDRIKKEHGHDNYLHVFPAAPVSASIELGRIWMPKADLPLRLYDENRISGGFKHIFDIGFINK